MSHPRASSGMLRSRLRTNTSTLGATPLPPASSSPSPSLSSSPHLRSAIAAPLSTHASVSASASASVSSTSTSSSPSSSPSSSSSDLGVARPSLSLHLVASSAKSWRASSSSDGCKDGGDNGDGEHAVMRKRHEVERQRMRLLEKELDSFQKGGGYYISFPPPALSEDGVVTPKA